MGFTLVEIDAGAVAGVLEHGHRLAALEHDDLGALEFVPREIGIRLAPGEEESVHLVDLGEMDFRQSLPGIE